MAVRAGQYHSTQTVVHSFAPTFHHAKALAVQIYPEIIRFPCRDLPRNQTLSQYKSTPKTNAFPVHAVRRGTNLLRNRTRENAFPAQTARIAERSRYKSNLKQKRTKRYVRTDNNHKQTHSRYSPRCTEIVFILSLISQSSCLYARPTHGEIKRRLQQPPYCLYQDCT